LSVDSKKTKRVILCSGKVYYDLKAKVAEAKLEGVALIRLEQFYPFPAAEVAAALKAVGAQSIAKLAVCWVQEEPRNMGAWSFVRDNWDKDWGFLHYVGRPASAAPAVGSLKRHQQEQARVIMEALGLDGGTE
jgi:2-oxoglutarate dehydrogenase E1 component